MNKSAQTRNWIIDAVLFAGLLLTFLLDVTGLELHQWLGLALAAITLYHLAVHWNWVRVVSARFIAGTSARARLYYVIDVALVAALAAVLVTGIVISTWLALPVESLGGWITWHVLSSIAGLIIVLVKMAAHWRWIVAPFRPQARPAAALRRPAFAPAVADRRQFLRFAGMLAASAAVPLAKSLAALRVDGSGSGELVLAQPVAATAASALQMTSAPALLPAPAPTATPTTATVKAAATATPTKTTQSTGAAVCRVRCSKRCSYPGKCRKYVDSNRNSLCDLGECA